MSTAEGQTFPGAPDGVPFRFSNGAQGVMTAITAGDASVTYYDGSATVSATFPMTAAPERPLDASEIRLMSGIEEAIDSDGTVRLDVGTPSCYVDWTGNCLNNDWGQMLFLAQPSLEACNPINDGERYVNYPCWENTSSSFLSQGIFQILAVGQDGSGASQTCHTDQRTIPQGQSCSGQSGVGTWVSSFVFDLPVTNFAEFDQFFEDCYAGSGHSGCGVFDNRYSEQHSGNSPRLPAGSGNMPVVNQPVPSPVTDPEVMNPGGYIDEDGVEAPWAGYDGRHDTGGEGTGGEGEEGEGEGGENEEGNGTTECEDCDGSVADATEIDLPLLDFAAPGWLPAACPQPMTVQVFQTTITVMDYSYICGFAGILKIIVMVGSSIVALRIVFEGVS